MTAKKPTKKAPSKRKPAQKKPVEPAVAPVKTSSRWRSVAISFAAGGGKAAMALTLGISIVFGPFGIAYVWQNWSSGLIDIGPGPHKPDAVSAVFDAQESSFRKYSGELAGKLKAGEVASEKDASIWMDSHFGPESEKAWVTLLTEEAKAFGGEQWTAEKHAAHIERYAR